MSVDEFLVWAEGRPGRFELVDGDVVAMSPQRTRHLEAKGHAYFALREAVREAALPCRALPDGATIRIDASTAYEPDALVYCGPALPGDAIEVPEPVIVVEVLSPSTAHRDISGKLAGYFRVPSVQHYLILDPDRRLVVHHARGEGELIATRIVAEGPVYLSPPGLRIEVASLFPVQAGEAP